MITEKKIESWVGKSWTPFLKKAFNSSYFENVARVLIKTYNHKYAKVCPDKKDIFKAFKLTPYRTVRIVIVGQDPYPNKHADGLAFSSKQEKTPTSLKNIFKEIERSTGIKPEGNNLDRWAKQGVLLLNTSLTTLASYPGSHSSIGWKIITSTALKAISINPVPTVFMLWGNHAQSMQQYIHPTCHLILTSAHPSPHSVAGFTGNDHFVKANTFLQEYNFEPINWK